MPPLLTPDRSIKQAEKFDANIVLDSAVAALNSFHLAHPAENIPRASLLAEDNHFPGLDIIQSAVGAFAYATLDFFRAVKNAAKILRFQACYVHSRVLLKR